MMRVAGDRRWLYTVAVLVLLPYLAGVQGAPVEPVDPEDIHYPFIQRSPDSFDDVDDWDPAAESASTPPPTTYVCKSDLTAGLNYSCPLSKFCCEDEDEPGVISCCTSDPSSTSEEWTWGEWLCVLGLAVTFLDLCYSVFIEDDSNETSYDPEDQACLQYFNDSNPERRFVVVV